MVIGKPSPNVRWFKDGKLLEENDHYMINEDQEGCHQLIITAVLPSDMGVYRCTAENSSGIAATKAELRVDSEFIYIICTCVFLKKLQEHLPTLFLSKCKYLWGVEVVLDELKCHQKYSIRLIYKAEVLT